MFLLTATFGLVPPTSQTKEQGSWAKISRNQNGKRIRILSFAPRRDESKLNIYFCVIAHLQEGERSEFHFLGQIPSPNTLNVSLNQSYFNQTQLHRGGKDSSNSYASIRERRIGLTRISHNVSGLTYAFSFIYYAFELKGESESMKKKYIHVNTAKLRVNLQHLKALTPEEAVVTLQTIYYLFLVLFIH